MKLYTYFRSSAAYRVRIALNLKGIPWEAIPIDIRAANGGEQRKPEYLAINPLGLVPVLVTENTTVGQSVAIIEYLEEIHPEPPLLPRVPIDRARVRSLALGIACETHPLNNVRVQNYLRSPLGHDEDAIAVWMRHWMTRGFTALEQTVKQTTAEGHHMFGSSVTMADLFIVPQMYNARRANCDLEPFPTLRRICAHLETLSAFAAASPERQPDAPPAAA